MLPPGLPMSSAPSRNSSKLPGSSVPSPSVSKEPSSQSASKLPSSQGVSHLLSFLKPQSRTSSKFYSVQNSAVQTPSSSKLPSSLPANSSAVSMVRRKPKLVQSFVCCKLGCTYSELLEVALGSARGAVTPQPESNSARSDAVSLSGSVSVPALSDANSVAHSSYSRRFERQALLGGCARRDQALRNREQVMARELPSEYAALLSGIDEARELCLDRHDFDMKDVSPGEGETKAIQENIEDAIDHSYLTYAAEEDQRRANRQAEGSMQGHSTSTCFRRDLAKSLYSASALRSMR
mmetsp:Transcript_132783/g.424836  ORF Transcript_132783/g.424836 Transcript_132783/m.424836 type:complete len:294 (-) Transcript_132783:448-1329(-)